MIKYLYLLRHGQAESQLNDGDFERTLTEYGRKQLENLSVKLAQNKFDPEIIYCSPAVRTRQTAEVLFIHLSAKTELVLRDEIYEASTRDLFELCSSIDDDICTALVIGHNPGLSYLADYITGRSFTNLSPGEILKISLEMDSWLELSKGAGKLMPL